MKPIILAKKYCANYLDDGTCVGVNFKLPSLEHYRFLPEGTKCLVACGQRCRYLETAVLPMKEWDWKDQGEGKVFKEAANRYFRQLSGIPGLRPKQRTCSDCGTPIGPRKRYCVNCAVDHK